MSIAVVSEVLKVRPVDKRYAGIRDSQGLAPLLCGLLEPSLLDEGLKALEDGVQVRPVGEDVVGESVCKGANLIQFEWFWRGQVPAVAEATAFARHAVEIALRWDDLCVDVGCHVERGRGQLLPWDGRYSGRRVQL